MANHVRGAVVHLAARVGLGTGVQELQDCTPTSSYGTSVRLSELAATVRGTLILASAMVARREGRYRCDARRGPSPAQNGTAVSRAEACGA